LSFYFISLSLQAFGDILRFVSWVLELEEEEAEVGEWWWILKIVEPWQR
jgi:hypothetical protein